MERTELSVEAIADEILVIMPEHKWMKGDLYIDGNMCLLGAYSNVMYGNPYSITAQPCPSDTEFLKKLSRVIREQFPRRVDDTITDTMIWKFNDNENTEYEDVRLVLEKVRAG